MGWFWILVAIITLALYAGTALVVSIGGFFDLAKMFRYLGHKDKESNSDIDCS